MEQVQSTQEKLFVTFTSEEDIIRFVDICCNYDDAIDVKADKMSTDAKSVMGMLLMKLGQPLEIEYDCYDDTDNYMEFREEIMQKFQVKTVKIERK